MKFRCERDVLVEALGTASRAVASRVVSSASLAGLRLAITGDRLHVAGSDLDLVIEVMVSVTSTDDGVAVVPARLLTDIVRAFDPGAVTIEINGDEAHISSGRSQFSLRVLPVEEFPRLPEPTGERVNLVAGDFAEALRQVVLAASRDDARPLLTGVLLATEQDGLRMVATDSYRLALRDLPGTNALQTDQSVLVPSRALAELARLLTGAEHLVLQHGEQEATFEVGDVRLTTRLIEGEFPNYRQLIPSSYPNRLVVNKDAFVDAVRRVKLLAREATPVRLNLHVDGLELTAVTQDVGHAHEDLDAKYEGSELAVAFNAEFLIAGVEAVSGEEVVLETIDASKPAVIRAMDDSNYLYLLMPVRVP